MHSKILYFTSVVLHSHSDPESGCPENAEDNNKMKMDDNMLLPCSALYKRANV